MGVGSGRRGEKRQTYHAQSRAPRHLGLNSREDNPRAGPADEYRIIYMTRRKMLHGVEELRKAPELQSRGTRIFRWRRELLKRLIQSGVFRRLDPTAAAQIALAVPHGLVSKFIAWPDFAWANQALLTETLIETFIAGLQAKGA
jgi:hypothetical protein